MNEFTKEELEDIEHALITVYMGNSELVKRIQSMIESYCEHEWEYKRNGSIVLGIYCLRCRKKLRGN